MRYIAVSGMVLDSHNSYACVTEFVGRGKRDTMGVAQRAAEIEAITLNRIADTPDPIRSRTLARIISEHVQ